jgi:hypothetical protein
MSTMPYSELLDLGYIPMVEAQRILGLSVGTIYKMAKRRLQYKRGTRGTWWFRRDQVIAKICLKKIVLY